MSDRPNIPPGGGSAAHWRAEEVECVRQARAAALRGDRDAESRWIEAAGRRAEYAGWAEAREQEISLRLGRG